MNRLENLYKLGTALLKTNRRLTAFYIQYNQIKCHIVFHRLKRPQGYWTIELSFINTENIENNFTCLANRNSLSVDYYDFCNFFHIKSRGANTTPREIMESFYHSFNQQIPTKVKKEYDKEQTHILNNYIRQKEPVDEASKIYLFDLRHFGNRSEYNNDKAAFRYPEIYSYFEKDTDYSFCFTNKKEKEVTLEELLRKLEKRN